MSIREISPLPFSDNFHMISCPLFSKKLQLLNKSLMNSSNQDGSPDSNMWSLSLANSFSNYNPQSRSICSLPCSENVSRLIHHEYICKYQKFLSDYLTFLKSRKIWKKKPKLLIRIIKIKWMSFRINKKILKNRQRQRRQKFKSVHYKSHRRRIT